MHSHILIFSSPRDLLLCCWNVLDLALTNIVLRQKNVHTLQEMAACSFTFPTAGPSPRAPFPWQNFLHSILSILQSSLPTINLLLESFSVIPSITSILYCHSCLLAAIPPLTTVCTNGWLSILLTASVPSCVSHAGMTKTVSWPLTR